MNPDNIPLPYYDKQSYYDSYHGRGRTMSLDQTLQLMLQEAIQRATAPLLKKIEELQDSITALWTDVEALEETLEKVEA